MAKLLPHQVRITHPKVSKPMVVLGRAVAAGVYPGWEVVEGEVPADPAASESDASEGDAKTEGDAGTKATKAGSTTKTPAKS